MRLVYFGNGPFAKPALEALAAHAPLDGHEIVLVVTRPDRAPPASVETIEIGPVKQAALLLFLPQDEPEDVNAPEFLKVLRGLRPDLLVVADFGQILSSDCLATARYGGINLHASLLPRYRGAAPVAWAILNGETLTGVSVIQMNARVDAGGVILQQSLPIAPDLTAGKLEAQLAHLAATMLLESVALIAEGRQTLLPQDPVLVSRAPKLKKQDGLMPWNQSADFLERFVRAMQPWPVAFTHWVRPRGNTRIQLLRVTPVPASTSGAAAPGTVVYVDEQELHIQTGTTPLALRKILPAGKKAMDVETFLRGNHVTLGDCFE